MKYTRPAVFTYGISQIRQVRGANRACWREYDQKRSDCRRGVDARGNGPRAQRLRRRFRFGELLDIVELQPDTGGAITGVVTGLEKSTLGPDGLPVGSTPGTFQDVNAGRTPLVDTAAWPCHARNKLCLSVKPDTAVRHLCEFLPEWTGRRQRRRHRLHISDLSGTFDAPAGGSVTFTLGSDDDAWVFLNGKLVVDWRHPGGHAPPTTISDLVAGTNTVEVFFADRHTVQAALTFDADVTLSPSVPEASTWAMMLIGFAGVGFAAFQRGRKATPASA